MGAVKIECYFRSPQIDGELTIRLGVTRRYVCVWSHDTPLNQFGAVRALARYQSSCALVRLGKLSEGIHKSTLNYL